jgi:DNA-binding transcriptional ArsR family regulator
MRIIQTLVTKKELSTQEISQYLPDVPQATLYRHLHTLVHAHIIKTVHELKKRGTMERIYALNNSGSIITKDDLNLIHREEHFQYFFSFLMNLLTDYDAYLKRDHIQMEKDGVSYRQAHLFLSDEELQGLMQSISELIVKHIDNTPTQERTLRSISHIVIPK